MIDIDEYEGHSTGWKRKINHSTYSIINDDGQKVASVPCYEECSKDSQLIADAPDLLAEVKRLREENNRYLDFIFWLGIEHEGEKLAWEYGDEKIAELLE